MAIIHNRNRAYFFLLFWLMAVLWIAASTIGRFNNGYLNQSINNSRIMAPLLCLLFISLVEHFFHFKLKNLWFLYFRRILAVPFLTLGLNWICIFTLTQYRSHHRVIIIPLAIMFISIGMALAHYNIYQDNEDNTGAI